jgi:hypothetical protein
MTTWEYIRWWWWVACKSTHLLMFKPPLHLIMLYLFIDNYIEEFRTLKREEILISIDLFIYLFFNKREAQIWDFLEKRHEN